MLELVKRLNEQIKNNKEMSESEKKQCIELLNKLTNIIWCY